MTKFILGYRLPEDSELTEFPDKKTADFESEEWCEVEAETLEEAKQNYEASFAAWKSSQQNYLDYVEGMKQIGEQPATFEGWKEMEEDLSEYNTPLE